MARRLTNIRADEVSLVDRGAGYDCKVVITKRAGDTKAERLAAARAAIAPLIHSVVHAYLAKVEKERVMSDFDELQKRADANVAYAKQEQEFALKMFPESRTIGEALAKWHATAESKRVQAAALEHSYAKMQRRVAMENSYTIAKSRPAYVPGHQTAPGQNGDSMDQGDWGRMDSAEKAAATEALIRHYMSKGDSRDVATTKVLRAQKAEGEAGDAARAAESDVGSHQDENSRGRRRVSGASVNPKAISP
jgi:hypothetical protein